MDKLINFIKPNLEVPKIQEQSRKDFNLNKMPWYKFINNELDIINPDNYEILETVPDCVDGPYLCAIFADEIPDDPERRPDIEGTPGLLIYIIRALTRKKGQPSNTFPPVPLEVRMSVEPANGVTKIN
ncbi:hypothetical protein ACSBL2_17520 [Pedobacter sp. AW31-3R]|uniref:hypothetical protein n=1 Tax=Pedobacter sp. AW31-3R TaxID=3445781 RepID=UPI003FA0D7ED